MTRILTNTFSGVALVALPLVAATALATPATSGAHDAAADVAARKTATAVFAGGCFWGVEAVFEHVKGVTNVVSGYAGGARGTAQYERVGTGRTGHAESVRVTYDPAKVSYEQLLRVFFTVAHDPTQLDRQGPDVGPQYRSAIFYEDSTQARTATALVAELTKAHSYPRPMVTQIVPLQGFYLAEEYHQDFAEKHPSHPYIVAHDRPKVAALKRQMPDLYRAN